MTIGIPASHPVQILRRAVESYTPYLQPSGELHDPVFGEPTQYGTPYHALCNSVLALSSRGTERSIYAERALCGLDAALRHVEDPELQPNASGFSRDTGAVSRLNHRDFFWPPILKTYIVLRSLQAPALEGIAERIAGVGIEQAFRSRPPSNWAAVWLSAEWLRVREGLSPYTIADIDHWLGEFFKTRILLHQGFYQEPGHPNSYDLFTRYHLADMLMEGYDGAHRNALEHLMRTGLERSLAVQLSDGSLASAHRSSGQTWNLGAQCAYFTHAANFFREREPDLSRQAASAARLALASFARWQRLNGPYSPVENLLPPASRVGYETYTGDAHYGNLAMAFLAVAVLRGFDQPPAEPGEGVSPCLRIEHDPTYRVIAHHGPYSLQLNAHPAPAYDAFGFTDLTFGPGRLLHFGPSVRCVHTGGLYNLGLAHRSAPGRSQLHVLAHDTYRLLGEIERGDTPSSFRLSARSTGSPYTYETRASLGKDGVRISETTKGLSNYKTLLVPYLRDAGGGVRTRIDIQGRKIELSYGDEQISIEVAAPVEYVLHLPHGYESRRGLCGLLRVDLQEETEGIEYMVRIPESNRRAGFAL